VLTDWIIEDYFDQPGSVGASPPDSNSAGKMPASQTGSVGASPSRKKFLQI
jgi:hypothetical protein